MHGECFSELSFWNLEPFPIIASSRNDGSGLETMGHCDVGNLAHVRHIAIFAALSSPNRSRSKKAKFSVKFSIPISLINADKGKEEGKFELGFSFSDLWG